MTASTWSLRTLACAILLALCGSFVAPLQSASAQNDVMLQAFYWDVPVDTVAKNGTWWDSLRVKAPDLAQAGVTGIWTPAPSKGNFGIIDMGYGVFDHYDLGAYSQKGTVETRFGSKQELLNMVSAFQSEGIEVYADIILNHMYTGNEEIGVNPAVKDYVFDEAVRDPDGDGTFTQYEAYPTNEITWILPNAQPGDYYVQIDGYMLDYGAAKGERGYDLTINWDGSPDTPNTPGSANWEFEPNGGSGTFNVFPGSGEHVWAHVGSQGDIDEYKITVTQPHDIVIKLEARRETTKNGAFAFEPAAQTNGYYPMAVWYNGSNLASTSLEAHTATDVAYVNHTGAGEANYTWDYTHFHPVDGNDFLGFMGNDEVVTNTKFFGNDFNTFDTQVQNRLTTWGQWLTNTVGYDGYRLDFVRGYQPSFAAQWVADMPTRPDGSQRFAVGEYWGGADAIHSWSTTVNQTADVDVFDFPLKGSLTYMSNANGATHDMRNLNDAGLVRNTTGDRLSGPDVVTFVENHDTGKEHDKWVTRDWDMSYAYILFAEGRPCLFYSHYYGTTQMDKADSSRTITAPVSLQGKIDEMMFVRRTYLGGTMEVLSQVGNPYPSGDAADVYVARRQGNGTKSGGILVLNDHESSTKDLWVDHRPSTAYADWTGQTLVNVLNPTEQTVVQSDGRVNVWAPSRGYAVWVPQSEYVSYSKADASTAPSLRRPATPETFDVSSNAPNPVRTSTAWTLTLPDAGPVEATVHDVLGRRVATLSDGPMRAGSHTLTWDASTHPSGVYVYTIRYDGHQRSGKVVVVR